ncbi:MAG: hypothetical protein Greene041619_387 [Candidatus Peregrinibacteria bacterium Greene0416_19]|nr:MAG: hypothetical protein Greene041619_387 [Candidatus Peregrinibacteria bacterium Greene0416_19]
METHAKHPLFTWQTFVFLGFVILLSYLTYFHRYWSPPNVFWDENYHIASAQKYLHGVFFMEQHPPLGKMLVAAGEKLLHPNARTDQFLGTDYGTDFPKGFSFAGYRFFSAFLGWWTAALLFLAFLYITRSSLHAALLSFLYIFDNALIVHLRGAMLEGPLLFFCVLMILVFFLLREYRERRAAFIVLSILLGVCMALILTTKLLGMIMVLLLPAAALYLWPRWRKMLAFGALAAAGFLPVYIGIWQIHFSVGSVINPKLPDAGYYQASPTAKAYLKTGFQRSLIAFPVMIRDSWKFVKHYNNGAPRLDLCKADENGSPFYLWPIGARSISYRWETPEGKNYKYLYLQSNPVVWFAGLTAVIIGLSILLASLFQPPRQPFPLLFPLLVFLGMYVSFFIAVSRIQRVLYLYHYFIPLLLTFVILAILVAGLRRFWTWNLTENGKGLILLALSAFIFVSYQFYYPLTRYEPLTDKQFKRRAILSVWELTCVKCQKENGVAVPRK